MGRIWTGRKGENSQVMMKNYGNNMNINNLRAFEEMDLQEQKKKKNNQLESGKQTQ